MAGFLKSGQFYDRKDTWNLYLEINNQSCPILSLDKDPDHKSTVI